MRDDLKSAFRSFRSSPSFTIAALVVLTLGIGATTAIFSVVDAVVLRGLPFDEHDRLVAVGERPRPSKRSAFDTREPDALMAVAPQNYADWAAQQHVFESIAAIASGWLTLREPGGEPESIVPQRVTASFFKVLRVTPAIGRPFTPENETPGFDRVVVLSDGLWRRRFAGDPGIIGRRIPLEDLEAESATAPDTYEVVGVMPPAFTYPVGTARPTDLWIPYVVPANQRVRESGSRNSYLQVIARLKPGVSLQQAQAQLDHVARGIEDANPAWNKDDKIGVRPLVEHLVGSRVRSWMLMLLGAVTMVLLIACANVANLLLVRGSAREREIGIRSALGAGRWRLVRQLMIESVALSAMGTACAIVVAWWAVALLKNAMPDTLPRVSGITLDLRVLAAAAVLAVMTAILFGAVPAAQLSRPDLSRALKDGARSSAGAGRSRLRGVLVIAELALAVVLLVGAALFIGSFLSLVRIDPGFGADHVLTAMVAPRIQSRARPVDASPALSVIVDRIRGIPGVIHASVGTVPFGGSVSMIKMTIPGRSIDPNAATISVRRVTPDYHAALQIPLRKGRLLTASDRMDAPLVALINEASAKTFFPGENPLGRTLTINQDRTIVGVVADARHVSPEIAPQPEAYVPLAQSRASGGELIIRTSGNPYDVLPAVKAAVYSVLPDVPLRNVRTMDEIIERRMAQRKVSMLLLGLFGVLGLVIAAVGIYGVLAYLVTQRTREIGVRMALGATRSNIVSMVLINAGGLVATGLFIGTVAAWYVSATSKAFLYQLEPTDARAFGAAMVSIVAAAFAASVIPARRAASIDPMVALRSE